MLRAAVVTLVEVLLLAGCLFGAAGRLSWPVLVFYSLSKVAAFAFLEPDLLRERAAYQAHVRWRLVPGVW